MMAWEMVKIAREELKPGMVLKISEADGDKNSTGKEYRIIAVYPNLALAERQVRGGKIRRGFCNWTLLKALGKVQSVDLHELGCGERRKDGASTHARNLLEEESFREACELHSAGKISQRNAARKCNISQATFVKYYAQYMAQKN